MLSQVDITIESGGKAIACLRVSVPGDRDPTAKPWPIVDARGTADERATLASVRLLESEEYVYEVVDVESSVALQPSDIFRPDAPSGVRGRLRTRLRTGTVQVAVSGDMWAGTAEFEVRSRKVDYLSEYQLMLTDLSEAFAEAVMMRFAASGHPFEPDESATARTLYQRVALLQSMLGNGELEGAIQHVMSRPHVRWDERLEVRDPAQGVGPSSTIARDVARGGARQSWPDGRLPSLPVQVNHARTESTLDTVPNRFVRYAVEHWRSTVLALRDAMSAAPDSMPVRRGRAEMETMLDQLDAWLAHPVMREASPMRRFPASNQVLQKREGYRDIMRTFIQAELASRLTWEGSDDVFGAGTRNVAALYEYWVYLRMARLVADLAGVTLDFGELVEVDASGVNVRLKRGQERLIAGDAVRSGVSLRLELWFNKTFKQGSGSWTRELRPDCAFKVEVRNAEERWLGPVWLHFDAKYRVDTLAELFDLDSDQGDATERQRGGAKGPDLLKMHAYRDAIHRSVGSFVVYPGDKPELLGPHRGLEQVLPGLGAFVLRPQRGGVAFGESELRSFLSDVVEHFASRVVTHRSAPSWTKEGFSQPRAEHEWLPRPPPFTWLVLGYVRGKDRFDWVREQRSYNVRADERFGQVTLGSRVLSADLVLLYTKTTMELWRTTGRVDFTTGSDLAARGYPSPGGEKYFLIGLAEPVLAWRPHLSLEQVMALARERGDVVAAPAVMSWLEFIGWSGR